MTPFSPATDIDTKPWYKQFWPWFIIFFPFVAVVAGLSTVAIAINTHDGVVDDEYYKEGLAINRLFDQRLSAEAMHLNADVQFNWQQRAVTVKFNSDNSDLDFQDDLVLLLSHPTRQGFDICVTLHRKTDTEFVGFLPLPVNAFWHVFLRDLNSSWRLAGRHHLPEENNFSLYPG